LSSNCGSMSILDLSRVWNQCSMASPSVVLPSDVSMNSRMWESKRKPAPTLSAAEDSMAVIATKIAELVAVEEELATV
jgi:hypothetical protein